MHATASCGGHVRRQACERRDGGKNASLFFVCHSKLISYFHLQCKLGGLVGYAIRFEDCTTEETKIKCTYFYVAFISDHF